MFTFHFCIRSLHLYLPIHFDFDIHLRLSSRLVTATRFSPRCLRTARESSIPSGTDAAGKISETSLPSTPHPQTTDPLDLFRFYNLLAVSPVRRSALLYTLILYCGARKVQKSQRDMAAPVTRQPVDLAHYLGPRPVKQVSGSPLRQSPGEGGGDDGAGNRRDDERGFRRASGGYRRGEQSFKGRVGIGLEWAWLVGRV